MLLSLHIENIAVIKCVDFNFDKGFMVLTGETGAGKSIVIDGINLLLGAKAERELIRTGAESATVSGLFGQLSEYTASKLAELGVAPDDDGFLMLQRTISTDGRSRIYINGRSVSLALLKSIAPYLVTVHGQSDTAALVDSKKHVELLDVVAGSSDILGRYRIAYKNLADIRKEISDINERTRESERLREILQYQINDIDSVAPYETEEDELVDKKVKIKNSEKITRNSEFVFKALKGSEAHATVILSQVDRDTFRKLEINLTCEPHYESKKLYHK
jgi:DNA repair protein RecN (Recombination protein N)